MGLRSSYSPAYARQAQDWLDGSLRELLAAAGRVVHLLEAPITAALRPPSTQIVRGSRPWNGDDNLNLPELLLQPQGLDPTGLPTPVDDAPILRAMVVHDYAHNGGWFLGQARGCPAGARARVLWTLHDARGGQLIAWGDHIAQHLQPYFHSPNDSQLQDHLLDVEDQLRRSLARRLRG